MYHHLRGTLARKTPAEAVVDVGGVGYRLTIPLSTYEDLPAVGAEAELLTTLVVREDLLRLYGFRTEAERSFFALLQGVSGVGPQVASRRLPHRRVGLRQQVVERGPVGQPVPELDRLRRRIRKQSRLH